MNKYICLASVSYVFLAINPVYAQDFVAGNSIVSEGFFEDSSTFIAAAPEQSLYESVHQRSLRKPFNSSDTMSVPPHYSTKSPSSGRGQNNSSNRNSSTGSTAVSTPNPITTAPKKNTTSTTTNKITSSQILPAGQSKPGEGIIQNKSTGEINNLYVTPLAPAPANTQNQNSRPINMGTTTAMPAIPKSDTSSAHITQDGRPRLTEEQRSAVNALIPSINADELYQEDKYKILRTADNTPEAREKLFAEEQKNADRDTFREQEQLRLEAMAQREQAQQANYNAFGQTLRGNGPEVITPPPGGGGGNFATRETPLAAEMIKNQQGQ